MKRNGSEKAKNGATAAASESALVARLLKRLKSGRDLRKGKIRRVKSALRHEAYFNALKMDVAADRLAGELTGDA